MNKKSVFFIVSSLVITLAFLANLFIERPNHETNSVDFEERITSAKAINQQLHDKAIYHSVAKVNKASVASLSGVNHEATLLTDKDGNLRVDESVKELFEFYLSSIGEETLDQVLLRIQSELSEQLNPPALDQALDLLKRYVDYKIELASIEQELPVQTDSKHLNLENIKYQKAQLTELRTNHFDQIEFQQFFEQEELYDNYMIRHLEISQDTALSESIRRQSLISLEQSLPEKIQVLRQKVSLHGDLYERANKMKATGSSAEEIYQVRAKSLGEDAASALAILDKKRAVWQQRLTDYTQQRNTIVESGLSQQDQLLAINDLINANFTGRERLRVKALNSSL